MSEYTLSRLLPPNSTPLERAALDTADGIRQDVGPIRNLSRPLSAPGPLLPWLAWSVDVLAWPRTADPVRRRDLIRGSFRLHQLQGTLAGFRAMAGLFDGEIVRAIVPPAKLYAAPALSRAERNAFVSRYPELRIYRHRMLGSRLGLHCGDPLGRWAPLQSDAQVRLAPRAYMFRDSQESELMTIERQVTHLTRTADTLTEVRAPGQAAGLAFVAAHPRYPGVSTAANRLYRLRLTESYQDTRETLRRTVVQPGLVPLSAGFDAVALPGLERGLFIARPLAGCLIRSSAPDRIFQRLYLFDPAVSVLSRHATLHLNAGRLGMPAHHAELAVRLKGSASRQTAGRYCRGYLVTTDKRPLTDCLGAMRDVMRTADRIGIDTTISRPARAGESVFSGALRAGDWLN